MNINQQIDFMQAAANPFPLEASFGKIEGGYECKMCGAKVKDQNAATDHLLAKHREMEAEAGPAGNPSEAGRVGWDRRGRGGHPGSEMTHPGKRMEAGGPGSGRHKENGTDQYKYHWGAVCSECGKTVSNGEYSKGESDCHKADVVPEEHYGRMEAREFSKKQRKKLAKSGKALPGGGFPIVNKQDLKNAKQAIGRAKNPAAARRHINERAKELGAKPIGAQVEFSPEMRLRMPKKAGEDTTTQSPQYTGNEPEFRAATGFHFKKINVKKGGGACSSHGFHRGPGYESKAARMGHRMTLSGGGPGSGRHPEGGSTRGKSMEELANMHKPHEGMCNLADPICRSYVDMKIEHPGFDPKGAREPYKPKKGMEAAARPIIRQRPARPGARPRRASYSFRGEQQLI